MTNQYRKDSPESIQALFNSIASRYDRANSLMSFHMHALWNQRLVSEVVARIKSKTVLDLCAGTGEISWRTWLYYKKHGIIPPDIHLVDFSHEMLTRAEEFCQKLSLDDQKHFFFHVQDAEKLLFEEQFFDAAFCAYGIRNIRDRTSCLKRVHKVLKPGGLFAIAELTRPENLVLKTLHKAWLKTAIPLIGRLFCRNDAAYTYLTNSIEHFVSPQELKTELAVAGFDPIEIIPLHAGIVTIIIAKKKP